MAGDRFRGGELVSVNAAMIIAYGLGALVGPPLGGVAMDLRNPQGLLWLFVVLFAGLLATIAPARALGGGGFTQKKAEPPDLFRKRRGWYCRSTTLRCDAFHIRIAMSCRSCGGAGRRMCGLATTAGRRVMDAWWSEATSYRLPLRDGGAYIVGPFRGVIHTTEFKYYTPSTTSYYGKFDPPHFTLVMEDQDARFYQHFPITAAARALEHNAGTIDTNRRSAIQIELAWTAAEIADLPEAMLERLWDWMRWANRRPG